MTVLALAAAPPGPVLTVVSGAPAVSAIGGGPQVVAVSGTGAVAAIDGRIGTATVTAGSGIAPQALALVTLSVAPTGGVLALDVSTANTFRVALAQSITTVALTGWPAAGRTERVTLYLVQDAVGGRAISGWPGVRWSDGAPPTLSPAPNAVDCIVLDTIDGGLTVFGNLVGQAYS